jgi:5'-methylthioadenosine phosphorylase
MESAIGIIGGSGLYEIDGIEEVEERAVETPFGAPSDTLVGGRFGDRPVWFLPRHGRGHRILPHEINHRANIWALRHLGVRWIICITAVGSLRQELRPRDVVVVDQYFDRMSGRAGHTFFGGGIAAHVGFGHPLSEGLRGLLIEAARAENLRVHTHGTYVNMDGPAFSTRAESEVHRKLGFDVVGMTNMAEAKLAREAEIALASLAMVTDYDCWHEEEEHVNVETVVAHMKANSVAAKRVLQRVLPMVPAKPDWPEHRALDGAIMTPRELWPEARVTELAPILERLENAR